MMDVYLVQLFFSMMRNKGGAQNSTDCAIVRILYQIRLNNDDLGTPQNPPGETPGPPFGHCSTGFDIIVARKNRNLCGSRFNVVVDSI